MPTKQSSSQRLLAKIKIVGSCWEWQGWKDNGYGKLTINGHKINAHRFVFMYFNNIPYLSKRDHVHHICYNKSCVNPSHLELLSIEEHMRIENNRERSPYCRRGLHLLTDTRKNHRCSECQKEIQSTPEILVKRRANYHKNSTPESLAKRRAKARAKYLAGTP